MSHMSDVQESLRKRATEYGPKRLAADTGLHKSSIYRWLSDTSEPSFSCLEKIAKTLGLRLVLEEIPNDQVSSPLSLTTRPSRPRE